MALELHIAGPGLETRRLVQPGEAELILGRDLACDINLPDPERNVSRRHLAVRNVGDRLQYRVLSQVNGIDIPQGYVPPGGQGLLAPGQPLKIGDYVLHVLQIVVKDHDQDPWAVFDNNDYTGSDATLPRSSMTAPAAAADFSQTAILPEEDPFGDWGFESTFGPAADGIAAGAAPAGSGAQGGELAPFYKGLGLDKANLPPLSAIELEAAGRAVRVGLEGLCRVYAARAGKPEERKPGVQGVVPVKDNNPLKTDWPEDTKLQYLLGGRAASIGFVNPERALGDIVAELLDEAYLRESQRTKGDTGPPRE